MFYSTDYLSYLFLGIGLINIVDRLLTELFVLSSHTRASTTVQIKLGLTSNKSALELALAMTANEQEIGEKRGRI